MIDTIFLTQRLRGLGYPSDAVNSILAVYIGNGQIDELLVRLEREEMAKREANCIWTDMIIHTTHTTTTAYGQDGAKLTKRRVGHLMK